MSGGNLYDDQYEEFFKNRDKVKGYDFQDAPAGSAPPPTVSFREKLRWWTWDRWKRMKKIREERDRQLQEIMQMKQNTTSSPK